MLAKQLNRQKYESFNYGKYEKLKKLFLDPAFEPLQIDELNLQYEKAPEMPNVMCLNLLSNLKVLVLSNNQISRFSGVIFAKELLGLNILDLSNNLIEELDDLADMNLPELRVLEYQGNYVCTYLQRITQIEQLLCPKRYEKYNPVKVFTAQYNQLPVCRLKENQFLQEQKDLRTIQRAPEEFKPEELMNAVSKYSHKNTLGKFALEICPVPRKTRFKNLEYLNGEPITKMDVIRVTGVDNYKQILETKLDEKKGVVKVKKSKIHEEYIKNYTKRINRLLDDDVRTNDPDEILKAKKQKTIDPKKFSVWETPLDIQYKDAEFVIGIEDFKQQSKEYAMQKKNKADRKRKRQIDRIKKKNPSFDEEDSDPEMRKLLNDRNKIKPKLNLSVDEDKVYRSSESSLSENISEEECDSNSQESITRATHTPKAASHVQTNLQNMKKQLERKSSQHSIDNQKRITRSQTAKQRVNEKYSNYEEEQSSITPQYNLNEKKQTTTQSQQKKDKCILSFQPIPAQRIMTKLKFEENQATFDVANKLSSPHPIIREGDYKEQLFTRMAQVKQTVQKERKELEQLHKQFEPQVKKEQQQKKSVRIIVDSKKNKKISKEPPQRELVKVHGDLDKTEYQKIQIPLEEMIPNEDQGVAAKFRQEFLFEVDSEAHKDLVHYKAILEESMNLREAWKEMDQKLEILGATKPDKELRFKANDFNAVHEHLRDKYKDKITPYEMREIVYGANDYDQQTEPKINEKEIMKKLEQEDVPQEERQILYKWIEILDDIRMKSIKPDEKRLRRIEIKEIERAQSFAHLAYHYQKLKKYVSEEKLQKYVKMMGIPLSEILQQDNNGLKIQQGKKKDPISRSTFSTSTGNLPKKSKKEPDLMKQMIQIQEDKAQLLRDYGSVNQQRYGNIKNDIMNNGALVQNDPYLISFLNKQEKTRNTVMSKVSKHQISFENMVEQNLRKMQDQFLNKKGPAGLEEQMMKYASEFKEKIKKRERLQQNIKQHISETQNKLDEFWMWEAKERELRYDKSAILMRQIKRLGQEIDNPSDD